jgi:DNA repair protein RadC
MKLKDSIKDLAKEDRPREKLVTRGIDSLSNIELLAILINTGTKGNSAIDIAKEILSKSGQNLLELSKLSLNDFLKIKGMGEKKAVTLLAALELGKRRQLSSALEKPQINSSRDSYNILVTYFLNKNAEEFYVLFLNTNNRLVSVQSVSNGGITSTVVDSRIIFKKALELSTVTQIIIAHNHPSGNCTPSEADKKLTQKIKEAGQFIDIKLLDHIIVGANQYFSFADEGLL